MLGLRNPSGKILEINPGQATPVCFRVAMPAPLFSRPVVRFGVNRLGGHPLPSPERPFVSDHVALPASSLSNQTSGILSILGLGWVTNPRAQRRPISKLPSENEGLREDITTIAGAAVGEEVVTAMVVVATVDLDEDPISIR